MVGVDDGALVPSARHIGTKTGGLGDSPRSCTGGFCGPYSPACCRHQVSTETREHFPSQPTQRIVERLVDVLTTRTLFLSVLMQTH